MPRTSTKSLAERQNEAGARLVRNLSTLKTTCHQCGKLANTKDERKNLADFIEKEIKTCFNSIASPSKVESNINPFNNKK